MSITAKLIEKLGLTKLEPEGGWFKQTYISSLKLGQLAGYSDEKMAGTAIYYLLTNEEDVFSELHRLPTDEVYHFYLGDAVELVLLHPDGRVEYVTLGQDILNGEHVQYVVPSGVCQGSYVKAGGTYALIGTTMAPGYTHEDYEPCERSALLQRYPTAEDRIRRLTRSQEG